MCVRVEKPHNHMLREAMRSTTSTKNCFRDSSENFAWSRAAIARAWCSVFSAMGLHPTEIGSAWRDDLSRIIGCFRPEDVAVGEVGMDLYWDKTFRDEQMRALEVQAQYAVAHDLPLVIHCREALPETLEVLSGIDGVRGVMHSFGGTPADVDAVRRVLGDDWYFGINGIVTFKNCRVHESLEAITLSRLLLETDSPYLAPVPHRGKRNESAYIGAVSGCVASVLGLESSEGASGS